MIRERHKLPTMLGSREETTMRAILIRYLPPTNHQGSRYKASTDAGSLTEPFDYGDSDQPRELAQRYIDKVFGGSAIITGMGELANGDYVATMGHTTKKKQ